MSFAYLAVFALLIIFGTELVSYLLRRKIKAKREALLICPHCNKNAELGSVIRRDGFYVHLTCLADSANIKF